MLMHPALRIDYRAAAARARRTADALTGAKVLRVTSPGGTDITLDATGRTPNFCPGYVDAAGALGSPPDIETNVSPVEEASNGVVVVDGSIASPQFGRAASPLKLTVKDGCITRFEGGPEGWVQQLEALFSRYPANAKVLAEFGIGFNPEAKLCGNMLLDEGCYGAFHFGFGSNSTVGGKNVVGFHLDFMFFSSAFFIDGRKFEV
jgi:leucyl aminopeptidase (aminopeptidase T)